VRFGRKRQDVPDGTDAGTEPGTGARADEAEEGGETSVDLRAAGPWDVSEVTLEEDDDSRLDLGSLLVTPHPDLDLQLQVDEASGEVIAVVMAGETGAAEVRAFAAPRNGDIWDGVRRSVAEDVRSMGGTATEVEGPWGTELVVSLLVELEDGRQAEQPSRVIGIPGPRWLLRATLFGRPAVEHPPDGDVEQALRGLVVVRGSTPAPPGEALPLRLPPGAVQAAPDAP
jgi:hypothetical protein